MVKSPLCEILPNSYVWLESHQFIIKLKLRIPKSTLRISKIPALLGEITWNTPEKSTYIVHGQSLEIHIFVMVKICQIPAILRRFWPKERYTVSLGVPSICTLQHAWDVCRSCKRWGRLGRLGPEMSSQEFFDDIYIYNWLYNILQNIIDYIQIIQ